MIASLSATCTVTNERGRVLLVARSEARRAGASRDPVRPGIAELWRAGGARQPVRRANQELTILGFATNREGFCTVSDGKKVSQFDCGASPIFTHLTVRGTSRETFEMDMSATKQFATC
jgi:hypothetical protein